MKKSAEKWKKVKKYEETWGKVKKSEEKWKKGRKMKKMKKSEEKWLQHIDFYPHAICDAWYTHTHRWHMERNLGFVATFLHFSPQYWKIEKKEEKWRKIKKNEEKWRKMTTKQRFLSICFLRRMVHTHTDGTWKEILVL